MEDSYLDASWEDQYDLDHLDVGDHDETNYDPYMGCDSWDYEAEASMDEGLDMYEPDGW